MSLNIARSQNLHLTEPSSDAEQRRPGCHPDHPGKQHYFVMLGEDTTTTTGSKIHHQHAESLPSLATTMTIPPTTKTTDARMLKSLVKSDPNLLFPASLYENKASPNSSSSSKIASNYNNNNNVLNNHHKDHGDDQDDNNNDENDDDDDDTVLKELSPLEGSSPMDSPTEAIAHTNHHHNNHTKTTTTTTTKYDRSMPSLVAPKEAGEWTRTTNECKGQDRHSLSTDQPNPENGIVPFAVSGSILWVWIGFTVGGMYEALQWHSFYPLDVVGGGGGLTLLILAVLLLLPPQSPRATTTTKSIVSNVCLLLFALTTLWIQYYVEYPFHTQQIWQLVHRHASLDSHHPPSHQGVVLAPLLLAGHSSHHHPPDHSSKSHHNPHHLASVTAVTTLHCLEEAAGGLSHSSHHHPPDHSSKSHHNPHHLASVTAVTTLHGLEEAADGISHSCHHHPPDHSSKSHHNPHHLASVTAVTTLHGLEEAADGISHSSHHHPPDHSSKSHHNPHHLASVTAVTTLHGLEEAADILSSTLNLSFRQIMDWGELLFCLGMFALNVQALWQRPQTISWLASFLSVAAIVRTTWLLQLEEPEKETALISFSSSSKMESSSSSSSLSSSLVWLAALATVATRVAFLRYNVFLVETVATPQGEEEEEEKEDSLPPPPRRNDLYQYPNAPLAASPRLEQTPSPCDNRTGGDEEEPESWHTREELEQMPVTPRPTTTAVVTPVSTTSPLDSPETLEERTAAVVTPVSTTSPLDLPEALEETVATPQGKEVEESLPPPPPSRNDLFPYPNAPLAASLRPEQIPSSCDNGTGGERLPPHNNNSRSRINHREPPPQPPQVYHDSSYSWVRPVAETRNPPPQAYPMDGRRG
ncbi:hypothetical protein ACA910_010976 [Epithemia clementina (nom. ined.)]